MPTLIRVEGGVEVDRAVGWHRGDWEKLTGIAGLGAGLPEWRPGCGSRSVDPEIAPELAVRFEGRKLASRRVALAPLEDEAEALFARGWSDGLPVVAPTERRVLRSGRRTSPTTTACPLRRADRARPNAGVQRPARAAEPPCRAGAGIARPVRCNGWFGAASWR